jgi:1-acyl-sn-glycerol-3-phosphate acyltransferase
MNLDEIGLDINWRRRAVTVPAWLLLALVLPLMVPLVLPVLALYDLAVRNGGSSSRTAIFFAHFFVLESCGLVIALFLWLRRLAGMSDAEYQMANRRIQRWWSRGLFWGSVKIFSVRVDIDGLEELEDPTPSIVLSRHASTLDTMIPLAIVRQLKLYRYVIKAELLADPAMDYVAQRFPNVFVRRGSKDPEREIQRVLALGRDLEDNAAVTVYPEGTRFSTKKRARLLEKFKESNEEMYAIASQLEHTLPPLREGALRLLMATSTDVVFVAHRGIDRVGAMSDLIKGGLTRAHLEVKIWRVAARDVPRDEEGVRTFLLENWRKIDRYVAQGQASAGETVGRLGAAA